MPHHTELIATIAVGLSAAFIGGLIVQRLRLPLIVGYLLAGVAVGPFTPGFVADAELAPQLAEIGIILLMFGVGIHFSIGDLLSVRRLALPGAIGQVAIATALGALLAWAWGWGIGSGIIFGLTLSVASTIVLLRGLEQYRMLTAEPGRVAVGWLVVEDLITILALVLLPIFASQLGGVEPAGTSETSIAATLIWTFIKLAGFIAMMLIVGVRVIPWILLRVARTGSRELFILGTLAIALGIAYSATAIFDVSFALGAFLAGVVVNESEFSHRAGEEALPLREAFSVLFFISVGMLIDPSFLVSEVGRLIVVVGIVIVGKAGAALLIVRALGGPLRTGLTVAAGLSQIGEFSFILAELGHALELIPTAGRDLVLAAALVSITLNPLLIRMVEPIATRLEASPAFARAGWSSSPLNDD